MIYLVLRFSTIGNVAMSVPVLHSLSVRYPEHQFVVVSRKQLAPMFYGMDNVHFETVDFKKEHKGIGGLFYLYNQLTAKYKIDVVVDIQNVLRTVLLRTLFVLRGTKTVVIDYGRNEKRRLVKRGAHACKSLKNTYERYADTFRKAGLQVDETFVSIPENPMANKEVEEKFGTKTGKWIGIAPFAKYRSNMLPFRTTKEIISHYADKADMRVFLFGAGEVESEMLHQWADVFGNVTCVAGTLPLDGELALMRKLDVMVCMDSANKHLSALIGQSAISIWGGTHPYAGFAAWKQLPENMLQIDLPCRPCTINGTRTCKRKDFACIKNITAQQVIEKVNQKLNAES